MNTYSILMFVITIICVLRCVFLEGVLAEIRRWESEDDER